MAPIAQLSRLSSQSSLADDGDTASPEVLETQHRYTGLENVKKKSNFSVFFLQHQLIEFCF